MSINPRLYGRLFVAVTIFLTLAISKANVHADQPEKVDFEKQILPLFVDRCSKCHSEDVRIVGLTLTTAAGIKKGSQNGPVVIPKNSDESLLYKRLRLQQMPPGGEGKVFDKKELELVRLWIDTGATMKDVDRRPSF